MNTVQILLRNGLNPEAFTIAFQKLMQENPEITPDAIQSIEKKDRDVLLTIKVPENADKGKIQQDLESVYQAQLEAQTKAALLESETRHNQDLQRMNMALVNNLGKMFSSFTIIASGENTNMPENQNQYNLEGANVSGSNIGSNYGTQIGTQHNYAQQQNLAQAAQDIQQLLQQLEQTYPTNNTSEKMLLVGEAVKQIENNPALKSRVIGALKAGGIETLKELVKHPLVNILLAALEGWETAE